MGKEQKPINLESQILDFYEGDTMDSEHEVLENELGNFETYSYYEGKEFTVKEYWSTFKKQHTIRFRTQEASTIQIAFFFGDYSIFDRIDEIPGEYKPLHGYIYFTPLDVDVEIYFEKDICYKNFDIYVAKDYFHELVEAADFPDNFVQNVDQQKLANLFPEGIPITPHMMTVLLEIKRCKLEGFRKDYFIKSRILHLLYLVFEFAENNRKPIINPTKISITENDIRILFSIRDFVSSNLKKLYTIEQLALKFGINEFKLKNGFRELFGDGVFHFALKLRMKEAMHLLKNTDLSIKEIAYQIGYSSPPSFSSAFKKEMGVNPNQFRKKKEV